MVTHSFVFMFPTLGPSLKNKPMMNSYPSWGPEGETMLSTSDSSLASVSNIMWVYTTAVWALIDVCKTSGQTSSSKMPRLQYIHSGNMSLDRQAWDVWLTQQLKKWPDYSIYVVAMWVLVDVCEISGRPKGEWWEHYGIKHCFYQTVIPMYCDTRADWLTDSCYQSVSVVVNCNCDQWSTSLPAEVIPVLSNGLLSWNFKGFNHIKNGSQLSKCVRKCNSWANWWKHCINKNKVAALARGDLPPSATGPPLPLNIQKCYTNPTKM